MNRNKKASILSVAVTVILAVILIGCEELPYKGPRITNVPPIVSWSQVQYNPQNTKNPILTWFSTDADGLVLDYQFVVLLESTVDSLDSVNGADGVAANFPDGFEWTIVHEDSSTVQLYADPDTSVYLDQFVFLRAMDDDSLFSSIIFRALSRNNHPPTCYLDLPMIGTSSNRRPDPQWCLPETTAAWKGIRVAWVGKDSIDIPGLQPDFDWNIRIYGPWSDSVSFDSISPAKLYVEFGDPENDYWIRDKEMYLLNLETGWYVVFARNRDDAFVPSVPALGYLVVYEPTWIRHPEQTKEILLANHTRHIGQPGELPEAYRDSVVNFYVHLLESAGYTTDDYDLVNYTLPGSGAEIIPAKSDLYNHELVIVVNTDWRFYVSNQTGQEQQDAYAKYLAVGGKMWVVGRRNFELSGDQGPKEFAVTELASKYFNLSGAYSQSTRALTQAEFRGAFGSAEGFPDVDVDTLRVAQTSLGNFRYSQGLIGVSYMIRLSDSETIYKYNSLYPDTSRYHNFPVATRYQVPGSFKTSVFAFPLYFIKTDQAEVVAREMLAWFFED
jgi:hypothetical protein